MFIPNRNLKVSKDCGFRLCRDGLDEAGATRVATELVQHVSGMAETQPLRGKALLRLFENGSIPPIFISGFRRYSQIILKIVLVVTGFKIANRY